MTGKFKRRVASTDNAKNRRIENQTLPMVLILIPVVWLALVAFFVILCQMAARGDAALAPICTHTRSGLSRPRPTMLEDVHTIASRAHGAAP